MEKQILQKKSSRKFFVSLFLFALCLNATAQNIAVSGKITDEKNEPLVGVSVTVAGIERGTMSDLDGNYRLNAPQGAKIKFVMLGYATVERTAAATLNVVMAEEVSELDEVVVVAYGTQKKKEITGAISVVDTKQIEKMTTPGIGQALQGLATGVHVTSSGKPGSGADIIIRGIGSYTNVQPLYVIDGMILESSQREFNMNDVESIQVLKDASATALYGARGANGVILVTTKKGNEGKTRIDFNGSFGVAEIAKRYEMMNSVDFLRVNRLAYANADKIWPGEPAQGQLLTNTDWQNEFYKTGITKDYNLNVSGGNKDGKYMFSVGMYNEDGVVVGPFHNRLTVRSNSEAKKGIFTIGENLMVGHSETKVMQGSPFIDLARMPPVIPVRNADGTYGYGSPSYMTYGTNPIGLQENTDQRQYNLRIIGSAYAQIEPIKNLTIKTNLGIEYFNWYDKTKVTNNQVRYLSVSQYNTELHEGNGAMQSWLWENTANYKFSIDKHNVDVMAGYTTQEKLSRGNGVRGYNILTEGFWILDQTDPKEGYAVDGSEPESPIGMTSVIGRLNYNYAERYLLQLNVRRDASSKFGANYRSGLFPAVSLGWRMNDEEFMKGLNWLNDLKLRASYGISGNQAALSTFQYTTVIAMGDRVGIFGPDGKISQGKIQNGMANPDLRWEKNENYNAGVDFSVLDQHIYGSFEYFFSNRSDLLIRRTLAWMNGTDIDPWVNYGTLHNYGVELTVGYREQKNEFKYDVALNFTHSRNKVVSLNGDDYYNADGSPSYTKLGRSIGEFYVMRTDGIFQNWDEVYKYSKYNEVTDANDLIQPNAHPGDIRYKDVDGDGVISQTKDREFVGSPFPDIEAGLSFNCSYKGFDLNLFFYGVYGNLIFSNTKHWLERMDETSNLPKGLNYWQGEGTSNTVPRPYMGTTDNVIYVSDRWLEDGSYLRLKNVQLGYTVPAQYLKHTKFVEKLRVYAGAQNLFTLTKYSGLDPEISGGGLYNKGYDDGHFPPTRMITFGLQVGF